VRALGVGAGGARGNQKSLPIERRGRIVDGYDL